MLGDTAALLLAGLFEFELHSSAWLTLPTGNSRHLDCHLQQFLID
tara:strand:+ start:201 stop:335 length:135 start_codon:yes stop_codon:yes gene_type:complete